jgi:ABC-2 type transport system permease protein
MNKIFLIIRREYLSRVKKKSFILMTILGPILLAGIMIVPVWLSLKKSDKQKIEVIDNSYLFKGLIPEKDFIHFDYPDITFDEARRGFYDTDYDAILLIPDNILSGKGAPMIYFKKQLGVATEQYIHSTLEEMIFKTMLSKNNVDLNTIKTAQDLSKFQLLLTQLEPSGDEKESNTNINVGVGLGAGVMIYMFIFLYGVQVMRGVMEEKTSRIVEVLLSSIRPFQLMMGKILGIALVGLTQFLLWVILTGVLYSVGAATILKDIDMQQVQKKEEVVKIGADLDYMNMKTIKQDNAIVKIWNDFKNIDVQFILLMFLFFFLGGYLMYSALFAAVGSAVDSEADTQQFMLPITIPLILSFVMAQTVIQNPDSTVAFWFSIIPLTSPIVMMVRLPFGVPAEEVALSMGLLVLGFIFTTWIAARIYRTGVLMYGKKVTWRELGKWLFYKG